MRARPAAVSAAFLTLSLLHAWWAAKLLLASHVALGGSQAVTAGALLLAAAAIPHRSTFSLALAIAGAATAVRLLGLLPPGPFFAATALLALAFALAAWGARRLDARATGAEALLLRGGLALLGLGYLAFFGAGLAAGSGPSAASWELCVRAAAAFTAAAFVDAPPLRAPRRNGFAGAPASAAR